ncbi:MAG: hypothetical protein ABII82_01670 [Verrucomicrobiota bacterium]
MPIRHKPCMRSLLLAVVVVFSGVSLLATEPALTPAETVRAFLTYQYGGDNLRIQEICLPSPDVWMLRGADQPDKLKLVESLKPKIGTNGLFMEMVGRDVCIVHVRDGKVDPRFNLETVYQMHRQLILHFMYYALLQEKTELARVVTDAGKVSFGGAPKASYGDMDVYAELLQIIPILRSSDPEADALSKTVTYQLPLGSEIFSLQLVKAGSTWKIDTDKKITVPLRYFWR